MSIEEILLANEEDRMKILANKNWDFYKALKDLPDEKAALLYKVFF